MGRKTGRVSIGVDRGNLRLRWRHEGKRYSLALGLPDDASNREIALMKAEEIEKDLRRDAIVPGSFDPTCAKYREDAVEMLSVWELFAKYVEDYKRKTLEDPRSLEKYKGLTNHLKVHFHNKAAQSLNEKAAFEFRDGYLKRVMGARTASGHLGSLRECWRWAQKRKLVKDNPWLDVKVKVPASPKPKPLTEEHVEKILECVQTNPKFTHWADFVRFCLSVGCRPGEAAGLQWKHRNCSKSAGSERATAWILG